MSRTLSQLIVPAVLTALIGASTAGAQDPWTSVGSAGTVDEADLPLVQLGTPIPGAVSMQSVFRGAVHVRYNVVAVGGVLNASGVMLTARLLDRGDAQRVVLQLKEYGLHTGLTTTLLTLDSDSTSFSPAPVFQEESVTVGGCDPPFTTLNFVDNAYFVDVTLSRFFPLPVADPPTENAPFFALLEPESPGPALGSIKLEKTGSICIIKR
jgi:hypothetical protein